MKKILLLLPLLLLGFGCNQNIGVSKTTPLKAPKERIIAYQVIHYPAVDNRLLVGAVSPTSGKQIEPAIIVPAKDEVEYLYASNETTKRKPYFSPNNQNISSAEYLPKRNDGKEPVAFYAEPQFYQEVNKVVDVKKATTTLANFNQVTKITLFDKLRSLFIGTAVATTTFNVSSTYGSGSAGTLELLVVAGGGAGGGYAGGGGGAGGVTTSVAFATDGSTVNVTVGAGGNPSQNSGSAPGNGGNSSFDTKTATGGGYGAEGGAAASPWAAQVGGSGGGGGSAAGVTAGAAGTAGQGNAGGASSGAAGNYTSGGGGGAGGVGEDTANSSDNANGGIGIQSSITGTSTYYAGGGGGGNYDFGGGTGGTGGLGGGGDGEAVVGGGGGEYGVSNTGGGGGGGKAQPGFGGGSGIVIVVFTASGAPAATVSGGTQWFFSQD